MTISEGQATGVGAALVLGAGLLHAWLTDGSVGLFLFALMIAFFAVPAVAAWLIIIVARRLGIMERS